ncbi:hypothetical protein D9M71_207150 [compost metagenome]
MASVIGGMASFILHRGKPDQNANAQWLSAIYVYAWESDHHRRNWSNFVLYFAPAIFHRSATGHRHASSQTSFRLSQVLGRMLRTSTVPAHEQGGDGSARLGFLRHHHRDR